MPAWERDQAKLEAIADRLVKIPGVHSFYVGRRRRDGLWTDEVVFRVLIRRKLPRDLVAPRDLIPSEIDGIPIDVEEADPPAPVQGSIMSDVDDYLYPSASTFPYADTEEYARLRGGIACEGGGGYGTLGFLARATDAQNLNKLVLVSNHHVLVKKGVGEGTTIYQPRSSCCCCGRKVGHVIRSRRTTTGAFYNQSSPPESIDAAVAIVNPGVECLGEMQTGMGNAGPTELVSGTAAASRNDTVKKRGSRTGPTTGTVVADSYFRPPDGNDDKADAFRNQLLIEPPYTTTSGPYRFLVGGDSGSAVMSESGGNIVGLLFWGLVTRPVSSNRDVVVISGVAQKIDIVMSQLNFTPLTATAVDQVQTNPASSESPTAEAPFGVPQPIARTMLDQARLDIERTWHGRAYAELIRRHHSEVWRLVRENRRVGAIWKRYGGQALVQLILNSVARPDEPIPSTIGARPVEQSTARIAAMLKRYGSAALASDVDAYERGIVGLCGCTYNQLLARLRGGEPVLD